MGRVTRRAATAFLTGALMVSSAWAGASLMPGEHAAKVSAATAPATDGVLAGAAKRSIRPRPQDYGGTWETRRSECERLSADALGKALQKPAETLDHLVAAGSPWPENPNCIYMGGFGLGPVNPVTSWNDQYGLWVRAFALRDRQGDDLVLVVVDGEGWFWDYGKKCADCGIKQLTEQLAAEPALGLKAQDIVIAATHAHSSPDFIGGWGFVPDWYMRQVADTIKATVRDAVGSLRPAVLEHGEAEARRFNSERRETYRSAEEQQLGWLRAYEPATRKRGPRTIATLGAYAAHPTTFGTNDGEAHPDWPGLFEKGLEERFGGIGLHFMTGLGNMTSSGLGERRGTDELGALIAGVSRGDRVENPDIRTARTTWQQPVTNVPLTALGTPGFFDRRFLPQPATLQTGEQPEKLQCTSASAVTAEVPAAAARIGDEVALTGAPGEVFSNFSNTLKEQSRAKLTLPLGQANDALGYMPQSFEMSVVGQQGAGFVGELQGVGVINYEDAYAVDRCFGDAALEHTIGLLGQLKP